MKGNSHNENQVFRFLQGQLSREEEEKLLLELKANPKEKARFLEIQKKLQEKVTAASLDETGEQWLNLKNRITLGKNADQGSGLRLFLPLKKLLPIAAAFLIGLIIASAFYYLHFQREYYTQQTQEISIPFGGKNKFNLPDGSVVWLNSGSKLTFPSRFRGDRKLNLIGEAFFEVVKSKNPFIVRTQYGEVTVLGTAFNVKAYQDDTFQATLVRGRVKVRIGKKDALLKPGEQGYADENNQLAVKNVDTEIFTSWKDGKLIFHREPFQKVARRMERWYNVNIKIENEEIKDLWFTGTIEMETLTEVMELISRSMPIHYTYDQQTRTLKIGKKSNLSN